MKKGITSLVLGLCFSLFATSGFTQTTAMDFQGVDCNGNMQHLFADLDAGNAVILEFFMNNCSPCVTAGTKLEAMKSDLLAEFPGKIKSYAFGFNNSYSCTTVANWVNNNGFTSSPNDSGAAQVSYYGGMGMPTIVILGGGTAHSVLGSPYIGFTTSDTTQMASDIRGFLNTATGIADGPGLETGISVYPNPANGLVNFHYDAAEAGMLSVEVIDLTGRKVLQVLYEAVPSGELVKTFSTTEIASGSYIIKASLNGAVSSHRFTVAQ
jgi:hypothetical protein